MKQRLLTLAISLFALVGCASSVPVQVEVRHRETLEPVEGAVVEFRSFGGHHPVDVTAPTDSSGVTTARLLRDIRYRVDIYAEPYMDHYWPMPIPSGSTADTGWMPMTTMDAPAGGNVLQLRTRILD